MSGKVQAGRGAAAKRELEVDVAIVGAGFAGLYALHVLREAGWRTVLLEAGPGVGGTWYWNRYPGARCDVQSFDYSYSFSEDLQQDWAWSEHYATQPEIRGYIEHVAERFDLYRDIRFAHRVAAATYESPGRWLLRCENGVACRAQFAIMATGVLSVPLVPAIEGLTDFGGRVLHTSSWPEEGVDFRGRDVAVIGTGSSGVQAIPLIAQEARSLTVLQRTANYVMPARNRRIDDDEQQEVKSRYAERRRIARGLSSAYIKQSGDKAALEVSEEARRAEFQRRWDEGGTGILSSFTDLKTSLEANSLLGEFLAEKIAEIVEDPATAKLLTPSGYPVGAKRLCVGTDYYETYNRPNVSLHDVNADPIVGMEKDAILTRESRVEMDDLVLATGFDAMTGALTRIDIVGRDGTLGEVWAAGPRNYLGLGVHGFPNLFILGGPGSPSVLANVVTGVEQQTDWVSRCLGYMRERRMESIEATREAEEQWVENANRIAKEETLFYHANSWYLGANVPGKPRIFMPYAGGFPRYEKACEDAARDGYRGFLLDGVESEMDPASSVGR
ncbi:MAG: flavin-containing monooxygenase [Solirubrobacterales bacterium]